MSGNSCAECSREFQTDEALGQHRQAKHTAQPQPRQRKKTPGKKVIIAVLAVILLVAIAYFAMAGRDSGAPKPIVGGNASGYFDEKAFAAKIPKGAIHWHPHVTLLLQGKPVTIPANVGLETAAHKPVHTHETDNILHWEVDRPTVQNMQLGYFFSTVWKKKFSSECILDYCNGPEGTVKMFVNGSPNDEFEHYLPHDGDEIKIVFE